MLSCQFMMRYSLGLFFLVIPGVVQSAEDLSVLSDQIVGMPPGRLFEVYLKREFSRHLKNRLAAYDQIQSRSDCQKWQRERRDFFLRQIGGLPERTPLNPRIVGRLDGEEYRVEKVIFESRPGHHVTANLYLPKTKGPYPGVLVPCGHSHNGKASGAYQRISILLARNGMAALCYDPIGQGERYQMLDFEEERAYFPQVSYRLPVPHPRVRYLCTQEHTAMGLGCILLGGNIAQFRIWDGMRGIDYLQSRDDILAEKIGCTGNSGGGTLTAYLMALDQRIVAAAPVCYLTTFQKLIETRGAQDAEQNIFGQIAFGMDEADYAIIRAPRPTLICAATRDATFAIDGTWELFREAKRFYARLGYPERITINEADAPHGFHIQQREAAVRWMSRWLLGQDKVIHEVDPETLAQVTDDKQLRALNEGDWTQEELYCTPRGQVLLMQGEKSVFDINQRREEELRPEREAHWRSMSKRERRDQIRQIIGCSKSLVSPAPWHAVGIIDRHGYRIEKIVLTPEPGIHLPALALIPDKPNGEATLYLHGESMKINAGPGGPLEKLVRQGHLVLSAELRGIGETETGHHKRDYGYGKFGRDVQEIFLAYLIGRSYVGMRCDDTLAWSRFLKQYRSPTNGENKLHLVALGEAAIPALHAAALHPSQFATVRLRGMIRSWAEVVRATDNQNQAVNVVHGVLLHYDLEDLVELVGKEKIQVEDSVNPF